MQRITELATLHTSAIAAVAASIDDKEGEARMSAVYAAEVDILSAQLKSRDDLIAARAILFEDGAVDFSDRFKQQLILRLLHAI